MRGWSRILAAVATAVLLVPYGKGSDCPASRREERGKWRVSVGASVIGGVRPRIGANHSAITALSGFGQFGGFPAGRSKAAAYAAGSGEGDPSGVRRFDGGAWYDPHDSASASDPNWSWNWRLHDPSGPDFDGRKGFTEYSAYFDVSETVAMSDGTGYSSDSSEWFPGLRVEVSRELYYSEGERPWGVDFAVAFAYYFQRGLWRANGTAANATEGYYEWWNDSDDTAQYILDYERGSQFHGGMWGAGSFDGPGAELETSGWNVRDVMTDDSKHWSSSHTLRFYGDGDYREYAIEILARPWWEPWEWMRVFASIGVEVSRREFEWQLSAAGTDGSYFPERDAARDWTVYGLLGGGLSLRWNDFVLAGEALWRFGGDDLEVSGQTVHGCIKSGDWGFRLSLGYEF